MAEKEDLWKRIRAFLHQDLWELEISERSRVRLFLVRQVQVAVVVWRDFFNDHCLLRASALTYTTLLAIVPLLALMFSVLKGLGVQNTLQPIILDQIAIGSEQVVTAIVEYINNTNVGRLGTVGLIALVVTVIALLSNIEESFNSVWGVRETRSIFRRFSDYSSVVLLGPLFLLAAISMTTTLENQAFVLRLMEMTYVGELIYFLFKVLPFLAMWVAFTFLYLFMPNIKVEVRAAVLGGIFGGTLWQLAQFGYINFQVGVARYNAIYGTMAALPIFMVWLYLSWLIVLLGLEVTYAIQNLRTIRREIRGGNINFASRELAALTVLLLVSEVFYRGEKPWDMEKISESLQLPSRLARSILNEMVRLGYLAEVRDGENNGSAYQPARAPEGVVVYEVIRALRESGISFTQRGNSPEWKVIRDLETKLREAGETALQGVTLRDLALAMAERKEKEGEKKGDGKGAPPQGEEG